MRDGYPRCDHGADGGSSRYGQEQGITDFNRLLAVYHNSTGLGEKLEDARGNMRLSEYLDSPQAEEQRRRYREMLEQEEPENGEEEMER